MDGELFPLSWLSQYGYCPRRCGLIALELLWSENEDTASGRSQHQRVHSARVERQGKNLNLFDLPVFSRTLGINGYCDCVEARFDPDGIPLFYGPDRYRLYPVEYKHGVVRDEQEYHIQLCAQAMCMEEQFGGTIPAGAIFFINSHRRDEVSLTSELREMTRQTARGILELMSAGTIPDAVYGPKCRRCSMLEFCQPKRKRSAEAYCRGLLNETLGVDW